MRQKQIIVILILEWKVEGNMVSLQEVLMLLGRAKTNHGQLKSNNAHYSKRCLNLKLDFKDGSVIGELKILDEVADGGSIRHRTQTSKLKVILYSSLWRA
jgi:hypothetical protein